MEKSNFRSRLGRHIRSRVNGNLHSSRHVDCRFRERKDRHSGIHTCGGSGCVGAVHRSLGEDAKTPTTAAPCADEDCGSRSGSRRGSRFSPGMQWPILGRTKAAMGAGILTATTMMNPDTSAEPTKKNTVAAAARSSASGTMTSIRKRSSVSAMLDRSSDIIGGR